VVERRRYHRPQTPDEGLAARRNLGGGRARGDRGHRDEAGKVVSQQSTILDDMRDLMAEQQSALTNARVERDEERSASQRCRDELKRLKRVMVDMLSGRVGDPEQEDEPRDDD